MNHDAIASEPFQAADLPQHPLVPAGEPELVEDAAALAELLGHVREVGMCCYDTEFIGESFYHTHLCLMQIATPHRVAVIDALAELDVTPVWELLADPAVRKIVHAGQQDLEPVLRHIDQPPANVLDTQIAAGFAGLPYPLSLTRLTQSLLDMRLGKQLTFTSWDHRPLSDAHLHYAANDVRMGCAMADALMRRLTELGTLDWALAESARLCDPARYETNLSDVSMKIRGAKGLSRSQGAVLHAAVMLRDELARLHDQPPRSLIRDEVLLELSRRSPESAEQLDAIRGLPRPIKADHGDRLLEAVAQGREMRKPPWPKLGQQDESPQQQVLIDSLWSTVQTHCRVHSVDPSLATNRSELSQAYFAAIGKGHWPESYESGWRRELLRDFLESFLAGERTPGLAWRDGLHHAD